MGELRNQCGLLACWRPHAGGGSNSIPPRSGSESVSGQRIVVCIPPQLGALRQAHLTHCFFVSSCAPRSSPVVVFSLLALRICVGPSWHYAGAPAFRPTRRRRRRRDPQGEPSHRLRQASPGLNSPRASPRIPVEYAVDLIGRPPGTHISSHGDTSTFERPRAAV